MRGAHGGGEPGGPPAGPARPVEDTVAGLDRQALLHGGVGLGVALICLLVPLLNHILSTFIVLVHEMGHALFMWLFGYPGIPAFDFVYGGGMAFHGGRSLFNLGLVYAGLGWLLYLTRRSTRGLMALGCLVLGFVLVAHTSLHEHLITFMGHGTELVIAALFLYRALSGVSIVNPMERPLYSVVGFFMCFRCAQFGLQLAADEGYRQWYRQAKGGMVQSDLVLLSQASGMGLETLGLLFALLALATPLAAYLLYRHREALGELLHRTFQPGPKRGHSQFRGPANQ